MGNNQTTTVIVAIVVWIVIIAIGRTRIFLIIYERTAPQHLSR